MITIDGRDFATVFKSIPSWLGEAPAICYLLFDGSSLRVRAATGVCLMEYVFRDLKIDSTPAQFAVSVAFDAIAGAFKGQKEIRFEVNNRSMNFVAGKYKGTLVLSDVRSVEWPQRTDRVPEPWIADLIRGSDTILLKKKVSSSNPLTVFFRQKGADAKLCAADGIHVILAHRPATTNGDVDLSIPYTSFQLLMSAFKKSETPVTAFVTETHLIIEDASLTLSVPLITESGSMTLDAIESLVTDSKQNFTGHAIVEGGALAHMSEFVERGKSLQDSDSDRPPPLLVKIGQNHLFVKFETKKGSVDDQITAEVRRGTVGDSIFVDPTALMDVMTTLASTKLSLVFVGDRRLAIFSQTSKQTGLVVGTTQ